jgi:hypothetical protein
MVETEGILLKARKTILEMGRERREGEKGRERRGKRRERGGREERGESKPMGLMALVGGQWPSRPTNPSNDGAQNHSFQRWYTPNDSFQVRSQNESHVRSVSSFLLAFFFSIAFACPNKYPLHSLDWVNY